MVAALSKIIKIGCLFCVLAFPGQGIFPQDGGSWNRTIPNMLRRPDRGESPRLPRDLVIGDLGQGEAPGGAYFFARNLLSALIRENTDAQTLTEEHSALSEGQIQAIAGISARNFRIGGGRFEADGSVSFLVRFIGPDQSITGEMFLLLHEEPDEEEDGPPTVSWVLDELILEERRSLREIRDSYRFDFSPYERFF